MALNQQEIADTTTKPVLIVDKAAPNSTDLAVDRTRLAHDRTVMAWIRTSASLISFGFTIDKFFEFLDKDSATRKPLFGPREFAMSLIAIGLVILVFATIQNRLELKAMRKWYPNVPYSMATLVAALVGFLGIVTFIAVVSHR
ncbi:MAG TPA: DUF202 domain-containing protein [Pyrinomonadaceae bacterium]|nr:DUF202 domain-containing protein [Pyrinomonadaceae bacterium]